MNLRPSADIEAKLNLDSANRRFSERITGVITRLEHPGATTGHPGPFGAYSGPGNPANGTIGQRLRDGIPITGFSMGLYAVQWAHSQRGRRLIQRLRAGLEGNVAFEEFRHEWDEAAQVVRMNDYIICEELVPIEEQINGHMLEVSSISYSVGFPRVFCSQSCGLFAAAMFANGAKFLLWVCGEAATGPQMNGLPITPDGGPLAFQFSGDRRLITFDSWAVNLPYPSL